MFCHILKILVKTKYNFQQALLVDKTVKRMYNFDTLSVGLKVDYFCQVI